MSEADKIIRLLINEQNFYNSRWSAWYSPPKRRSHRSIQFHRTSALIYWDDQSRNRSVYSRLWFVGYLAWISPIICRSVSQQLSCFPNQPDDLRSTEMSTALVEYSITHFAKCSLPNHRGVIHILILMSKNRCKQLLFQFKFWGWGSSLWDLCPGNFHSSKNKYQ